MSGDTWPSPSYDTICLTISLDSPGIGMASFCMSRARGIAVVQYICVHACTHRYTSHFQITEPQPRGRPKTYHPSLLARRDVAHTLGNGDGEIYTPLGSGHEGGGTPDWRVGMYRGIKLMG